MKPFIVAEKNRKKKILSTELVDDFSKINSLKNPVRQKILRIIAKKPNYPFNVAKIIGENEQTVYYHFKVLENSGLIKEVEIKQIRGTIAKKYGLCNDSISVIFNDDFVDYQESKSEIVPLYLRNFIDNGIIDAKIIVGSPDPHGPHKSRAKDNHYAIDFGLYIGRYIRVLDKFSILLDVNIDIVSVKNQIVVGGPVTNLACYKLNNYLPIKFSDKKPWGIITDKNVYTEDSIGMIVKIKNPFVEGGYILLIAGIKNIGTKAAILAITRYFEKIKTDKIFFNEEFYVVVQGYDLDGDGRIDSVEILEKG